MYCSNTVLAENTSTTTTHTLVYFPLNVPVCVSINKIKANIIIKGTPLYLHTHDLSIFIIIFLISSTVIMIKLGLQTSKTYRICNSIVFIHFFHWIKKNCLWKERRKYLALEMMKIYIFLLSRIIFPFFNSFFYYYFICLDDYYRNSASLVFIIYQCKT